MFNEQHKGVVIIHSVFSPCLMHEGHQPTRRKQETGRGKNCTHKLPNV